MGPGAHRSAGGAVAAARRRPGPARACCRRPSRGSTTPSCTPAPVASICRCCPRSGRGRIAGQCGPPRSMRSTPCPTTPRATRRRSCTAMVVSHENQHDETMLQALNLRTGAPLLRDTAALPAGRPGLAGTSVLVPAGPFVLGVDAASEPYSLDNERPAHVVDVPAFRIGRVPVTNGEWRQFIDDGGYRAAALVVRARLGAPPARGPDRAAVLELRRANAHPVRPRRRHPRRRAGAACHLLRGRGVCGLGRRPAAHRDGMGEGLRLGSGDRHPPPLPVGRTADPSDAPRQPRRHGAASGTRRAPTRPARRPTASSRCSATCGSGPPRRCGPGRDSSR